MMPDKVKTGEMVRAAVIALGLVGLYLGALWCGA